MDVSVIIPTRGRPEKAAACVEALTRQTLAPERYEVLVGLDGPDPATVEAVTRVWNLPDEHLILDVGARAGQATVRNRLLPHARGRSLVFLNDDTIPSPALLEIHAREPALARERGRPALIVGSAPWKRPVPDRLFDRLIRETSMVFFYDRMDTPESLANPMRDWGFRHAWMINLSAPAELVRGVGGLGVFPCSYGYEDDELAYRLQRQHDAPVLYRPGAAAAHDHWLTPGEYLAREYKLGYAAHSFARLRPQCAAALFGRDVGGAEEREYTRLYVPRELPAARRLFESFLQAAALPAGAGDGLHGALLVRTLYEQHLPVKRWFWRRGLLDAFEEREMHCPRWLESDQPQAAAA